MVFWISRPHSTDSATHRKMTLSLADRCSKTQKIRILPMAGRDPESHRNEMIKVLSISAVGFSTFSCYINKKKKKRTIYGHVVENIPRKTTWAYVTRLLVERKYSHSASLQRAWICINCHPTNIVCGTNNWSHSFTNLKANQLIYSLESAVLEHCRGTFWNF